MCKTFQGEPEFNDILLTGLPRRDEKKQVYIASLRRVDTSINQNMD
jgi:hypothetical protein